MARIGNSRLMTPNEAIRLSLASPRCAINALSYRLRGKSSLRFPHRIVLSLANRCNFACPMCNIGDARAERQKDFRGDAPFEVVERTIREAGKYGCYVDLTGGEPTLYDRLGETIALLSKYRLLAYITTNGLNLKSRAAELVEAGLKVLLISLDGWDEESSYERGLVPGSFAAIRDGIAEVNRIRRGTFPIVRISTVITKANYRQLDQIADAVYAMGVRRWFIQNYFFMTDGAMAAHRQMKLDTGIGDQVAAHHIPGVDSYFTPDEVAALKSSLARVRAKANSSYRDLRVDFDWNLDLDAYYSPRRPGLSSSCALPFDRVDIFPDGRIASCMDGHTIGNVLTGTIRDAWNGPERRRLLALLAKEKVLPMCFRCCGISYNIKFDETAVPYENLVQIR
jgi:sulfatase maturation enzyme AslB (radical SAM superfamily)